ncbi:hypothetical protein [Deinococcus misasensis]|uniref:hypothetical protein n=1 Tax=Deinococcus misasensis TaxID=392413 RepID=UPI00054F8FBE|nr:hypothetical protein [Deinococcus misasensis]
MLEYFRESKVVLIDDSRDQVENIIKFLSLKGIACNYIENYSDLEIKFSGVRFLILDLYLSTIQDGFDPLLSSLDVILPEDIGPVVILIFSNHSDDIDKFKIALKEYLPRLKYYKIRALDKERINRNPTILEEEMNNLIKSESIFDIQLNWESEVAKAVQGVSNRLYSNVIKEQNSDKMFAKIVYHFMGSRGSKEDNIELYRSILRSFTLLIGDEIDCCDYNNNLDTFMNNVKLLINESKGYSIEESEKGKLNSSINVIQAKSMSHQFGSLYVCSDWDPNIISEYENDLITDIFKFDSIDSYDKYCSDQDVNKNDIISVIMDISPPCDHAQDKLKLHKFVMGILVSEGAYEKIKSKIKKADSIFKWIKISINGSEKIREGNYYLIFNLSFSCSFHFSKVREKNPILLVRNEPALHIKNKYLSYFSRVGDVQF